MEDIWVEITNRESRIEMLADKIKLLVVNLSAVYENKCITL